MAGSIEWPWLSTPTHTVMPPRCGQPAKVTYPSTSVMELDVSSSFPSTHTPASACIYEFWHVTLVLNNNISYVILSWFSPLEWHPPTDAILKRPWMDADSDAMDDGNIGPATISGSAWHKYPSLPSDASTGANSQPRGHWVGFGHWFQGICTTTTTTTTFYQLSFTEQLSFDARQGWKNQCWGSNPTSFSSRCGTHWGVGPHCDNTHAYKWSGIWWWRDWENPMGERDLGWLLWWVQFGCPLRKN